MLVNLDFNKKLKVLNKIHKVSQAIVALKDKRGHQGMFTSLPALMAVLKPYLGEYGLQIHTHRELVNDVAYVVVAVVDLESGEYISSEMKLTDIDAKTPLIKAQSTRAEESFFKRIAIMDLFDITSYDSDYANDTVVARKEMRDKSDMRRFELIEKLEDYPQKVMQLLKENQPLTLQELPYTTLSDALENAKLEEKLEKEKEKIKVALKEDIVKNPKKEVYIKILSKSVNKGKLEKLLVSNDVEFTIDELKAIDKLLIERLGERYLDKGDK